VLGQLAQVVADQGHGLVDLVGEVRGGGRPGHAQQAVQPHAQRVGQCLERAEVGDRAVLLA